jgi:hypothetical protein
MLVSTRESVSIVAPIKEIFTAVYAVRPLAFSLCLYPVMFTGISRSIVLV